MNQTKSNIIETQFQRNGIEENLQIFELKQLADMEAGYKVQCRRAIADYKGWRARQNDETDIIELLYGNLQGVVLRRRAEDAIGIYWIIRHDFRRSFRTYLAKNCAYPSSYIYKKSA